MAQPEDHDRIDPAGGILQTPIDASSYASSREVVDPWKLKVVLTLDGGGVRGYGSLLMLQALMRKVEELENNAANEGGPHPSSFEPFPPPEKKVKSHSASRSRTPPPEATNKARTESARHGLFSAATFGKKQVEDDGYPEENLKPTLSGYLPCHYFDYIGGTSTGGLNAIMLGRLRMTVDQCIGNYPAMARRIFSNPRKQIKGWPKSKYDSKNLEKAIQDIVAIRTNKDDKHSYWRDFEAPDDLCRTFVVSKKKDIFGNGEDRYIFRTYDNRLLNNVVWPNNPGQASKDDIWKVGRATTAAPTFFKPMRIGDDKFSDGGIGYNNPAEEGYEEVLHKEGYYNNPTGWTVPICLFLSIGTGGDDTNRPPQEPSANPPHAQQNKKKKEKKPSFFDHLSNLGETLSKDATKTRDVDIRMRNQSIRQQWPYIRWTGGKSLEKHEMDKWKPKTARHKSTKEEIEAWINTYMTDPIRVGEIEQVARILVDVRRRRIRFEHGDRWQRYAYCSKMSCPTCGAKIGTCSGIARHMVDEHHITVDTSAFSRFAPKVTGGPF